MKQIFIVLLVVALLFALLGGVNSLRYMGTVTIPYYAKLAEVMTCNPDGTPMTAKGYLSMLAYDMSFACGIYSPVLIAHIIDGKIERNECKTTFEKCYYAMIEFAKEVKNANL